MAIRARFRGDIGEISQEQSAIFNDYRLHYFFTILYTVYSIPNEDSTTCHFLAVTYILAKCGPNIGDSSKFKSFLLAFFCDTL